MINYSFFKYYFSDFGTNTILTLENKLKSFPSLSMASYDSNNLGNVCYLNVRYNSATK